MQRTQESCVMSIREWEGMSQCVHLYLAARTRVEEKLLDKEATGQQQDGICSKNMRKTKQLCDIVIISV